MAIKDLTSSILKRLEEGTAEIYSRYRELLSHSDRSYKTKTEELEADYRTAANEASARARIDLNNTLEQMADSGYVRSGETVQATLSANAARAGVMGNLAVEKMKGKNALLEAKSASDTKLKTQAEAEVSELRDKAYEEIRQAEEAEEERKKQESQQAFENRLAWEKLELEKTKAASSQKSQNSEEASDGIVPKKSAYSYLEEIVKNNTKVKTSGNTKRTYVDKSAVIRSVGALVKNKNLSRSYRYELYLYAKSLGYTAN